MFNGVEPGEADCDGVIHPNGIPGMFPKPVKLTYEKAMIMLAFCKKRYAAYCIGKDGNLKTENISDRDGNVLGVKKLLLTRGIVLASKGNCSFLVKVYKVLLEIVLDDKSLLDAIEYLKEQIKLLVTGQVDYKELVSNKRFGANYKSDTAQMKIFADKLLAEGEKVSPGDRVGVLFVENDEAKYKGEKMMLVDKYETFLRDKDPETPKIDYVHYLENVLEKPLNQLLSIGFKTTIDTYFDGMEFEKKTLRKPFTLMRHMVENNINLDILPVAMQHIMEEKNKLNKD